MGRQNRSTAVMQRRTEAPDGLDYFPTPPWATRALCEHVLGGRAALAGCSVWEPACGEGHMVRPLAEYFGAVHASDIHDYGGNAVHDFLGDGLLAAPAPVRADWVITNPPFNRAAAFALRAMALGVDGVALLVRSAFLEGVTRGAELFDPYPPALVAQFRERVAMFKGRLDAAGGSATAYCWVVWRRGVEPTRFTWIRPCRDSLVRAADYRVASAAVASAPLLRWAAP